MTMIFYMATCNTGFWYKKNLFTKNGFKVYLINNSCKFFCFDLFAHNFI